MLTSSWKATSAKPRCRARVATIWMCCVFQLEQRPGLQNSPNDTQGISGAQRGAGMKSALRREAGEQLLLIDWLSLPQIGTQLPPGWPTGCMAKQLMVFTTDLGRPPSKAPLVLQPNLPLILSRSCLLQVMAWPGDCGLKETCEERSYLPILFNENVTGLKSKADTARRPLSILSPPARAMTRHQ